MITLFIRRGEIHPRTKCLHVEGLYCKRPIQCLASSKILTPPPPHCPASVYPPPRLWCGGRTHSLGGKGVGGQKTPDTDLYSIYVSTMCLYMTAFLCGLLCAILLYCVCSQYRGNAFYGVQSVVSRWNKL